MGTEAAVARAFQDARVIGALLGNAHAVAGLSGLGPGNEPPTAVLDVGGGHAAIPVPAMDG